jgi:hypothetical protein
MAVVWLRRCGASFVCLTSAAGLDCGTCEVTVIFCSSLRPTGGDGGGTVQVSPLAMECIQEFSSHEDCLWRRESLNAVKVHDLVIMYPAV